MRSRAFSGGGPDSPVQTVSPAVEGDPYAIEAQHAEDAIQNVVCEGGACFPLRGAERETRTGLDTLRMTCD